MTTLTENSTLQEIRDALAPIPDGQWMVGKYESSLKNCRCGLGHVNYLVSGDATDSPLEWSLRRVANRFTAKTGHASCLNDFAGVNDGHNPAYPQPTPKARVLALLDDMIAAGVTLSPETP